MEITPFTGIIDSILAYECGDPGLGTFKAEINIEVSKEITETFTVEEVDICAAFLFSGGNPITEDQIETVRRVFLKDYKFNAKRDVLCFGPRPPPSNPPPTDPPPTEPPPTDPPPTDPPPTDPPEPVKKEGFYESIRGTCGILSFTLGFTLDENILLTGFGMNEGAIPFDTTANPLNFDHPEFDLKILGVNGHTCTIMCNQAGDQITLTCSRPGASCTQTLTHKP